MALEDDIAPPQMSEAYHKARRQLSLFSAILIFWEYVGIRIGEKAAEPVTVKLPVADTKVRLQNPEVIPLVIVAIMLYFAFRLGIEWKQTAVSRRAQTASRVDLFAAYLLATAALLLYLFQQLSTFRLAEILTPIVFVASIAGSIGGFAVWMIIYQWKFFSRGKKAIGLLSIIFIVALVIPFIYSNPIYSIIYCLSIAFGTIIYWMLRLWIALSQRLKEPEEQYLSEENE